MGNNYIERSFKWNNGNLITIALTDKKANHRWISEGNEPDLYIPKQSKEAADGQLIVNNLKSNDIHPAHLLVEVSFSVDELQVMRLYRIYDESPTIACDTYFRGRANEEWGDLNTSKSELKNIESLADAFRKQTIPVLDNISLPGRHWQLEVVQFSDITDRNNTLVNTYKCLSYRDNFLKGNILFAHNQVEEKGVFFIKEAPCPEVQLAYPNADFITNFGRIKVVGVGLSKNDIETDTWIRAYSSVIGVYSGGEYDPLDSVKKISETIEVARTSTGRNCNVEQLGRQKS